jgi:hypothetical protein
LEESTDDGNLLEESIADGLLVESIAGIVLLESDFDSILIESIFATTSIESVLNVVLRLDDIVVSVVDALLSATGVDVSVALYGVLQAANEISTVAAYKILSFI